MAVHGSKDDPQFLLPKAELEGSDDRALLSAKTTAPSTEVPFTSTLNSLAGIVKSEKPHSKQTASSGKTHTMGLSRLFNPPKWTKGQQPRR